MICPKCGFAQDERTDCIKCGVVFAKYLALRVPESAPVTFPQEPLPITGGSSGEPILSDAIQLQEIRQGLRNLQDRFHDLEFEKAERRRLHGDMRALEERLKEGLGQFSACQDTVQFYASKLDVLPPAPSLQDFDALKTEVRAIDIPSVHRRLDAMENRLDAFVNEMSAWASQLEALPGVNRRLEELENRVGKLAELKAATAENETLARLESALEAFEEVKSAVQNVTLRYSEIGELKKNHLILQNVVETIQHATDNLNREFTNGTAAKILQLDKEVSALKAEARKAYERIETFEASAKRLQSEPDQSFEMATLREDLAIAGTHFAEERQETESRLSRLETTMKESLNTVAEIPAHIEALTSRLHMLDQHYQALADTLTRHSRDSQGLAEKSAELGRDVENLGAEYLQTRMQVQALEDKVADLPGPSLSEPQAPESGDMHVIRENLDEIRRFMATLSRKL